MASRNEEHPFKKARLYGTLQQVVTLVVGEDTSITVHQDILCDASPFFKSACKPEWMKPEDRVIKLPEDDNDAVQAMVYWMYHDEIHVPASIYAFSKSQDQEQSEGQTMKTAWGFLAKLYVLGEKHHIRRLRNDTMDAMLALLEDRLLDSLITSYFYKNTVSEKDPLRRFLVKLAIWALDFDDLRKSRHAVCPELFFDMAAEAAKYRFELRDEETQALVMINSPGDCFCTQFHTHNEAEAGGVKCEKLKPFPIGSEELS